ncbi:MAG: helix-turn-helix transcriptional regulator [Bacteroidales bacterium]|nr:helix-turn-helix transcriptional regulator [Bacteroidales bacterium]
MSKALEKIKQIASRDSSGWIEDAKARQANSAWTKRSFKIAVRILREIRTQKPTNGMTQKKLAEKMGVTPQYINKVVKGKENLTLETIAKIEDVLGISLIEVSSVMTSQAYVITKANSFSTVNRNWAIQISNEKVDYTPNQYIGQTLDYGKTG